VPEVGGHCLEKISKSPDYRPIAHNEIPTSRSTEPQPTQSREETDLEIPGLEVGEFEEIIFPEA
jgi:hypothetical protein